MRNKNTKNFWHNAADKERRLCFDRAFKSPDDLKGSVGPEVREVEESNEKQRVYYEHIESMLKTAIDATGSKELRELYKDPEHRKRMIALVRKEGARFRWLPGSAQAMAGKFDKRFTDPESVYDELKKKFEGVIADVVDRMEESIDNLKSAREDYSDIDDLLGGDGIEGFIDMFEWLNNKDMLRDRQDTLVEISRVIVDIDDLREAKSKIAEIEKLAQTHGLDNLYAALQSIVDKGGRLEIMKQKMLDLVVEASPIVLPEEDIKEIQEGVDAIDEELAATEEGIDGHMEDVFERQTRYLNALTGDNVEALIRDSILETDGSFSMPLMLKTLGVLGKTPDPDEISSKAGIDSADDISIVDSAELEKVYNLEESEQRELLHGLLAIGSTSVKSIEAWKKAVEFSGNTDEQLRNDLLNAWDTTELQTYLREDLGLNKEVPDYIKGFILRSRLPEAVATELVDGELNIRTSDIVAIASLEELDTPLSSDHLQKILKRIEEDYSGKKRIEKKRFVEIVSFLKLKSAGGDPSKRAKQAIKDAEDDWENLAEAIGADATAEHIIVNPDQRKKILAELTIDLGDNAVSFHKKMRAEEIHNITWTQNTKAYARTLLSDAKQGGKLWVDYIKNMGSIFTDAGDNNLLDLLNKRRGLSNARAAIMTGLDTANGGMKSRMRAVITVVQDKRKTLDLVDKPLDSAATAKEHAQQSEILAKGYAYVYHILRADSDIDNLPRDVQSAAMWIAMNKGTPEDPEAGIAQAKEFINKYHNAPRHLKNFQDAYEAFNGRMRLDEGIGPTEEVMNVYLSNLETYQSMARVNPDIYEAYRNSIIDVYNIFYAPGTTQEAINASYSVYKKAHEAYIVEANKFEDRKKSAHDPGMLDRQEFWNGYFADHPDDSGGILRYIRKVEVQKELEKSDNMDILWNRHRLSINVPAILALSEARRKVDLDIEGVEDPDVEVNLLNGSENIDRWLTDGEREFAIEPLRLILNGSVNPEGKEALIKAYIERKDVTYTFNGAKKVITSAEAYRYVQDIQNKLQFQSEGYKPSMRLSEEYENAFTNPLDRMLRASVDTMKDLWSGDMVDKLKVAAALTAGFFLIKALWKKGSDKNSSWLWKAGKWSMVGLPVLLFANSAYKNRTGRDILGEKLLYMPKKQRNSIIEQWRRRSTQNDAERYQILGTLEGVAAINELNNEDDPIAIEDLLQWRRSVKQNGYHDYKAGAPANLDVSNIMFNQGVRFNEDEAYEVAFLAFEALCTDVAALHGHTSGNIRERANWGANHIHRHYVDFIDYREIPDLKERLKGRKVSMADVMHSEAPLSMEDALANPSYLEWLSGMTGKSVEWVKEKIIQGYSKAKILANRGAEYADELYEDGKEYASQTASSIYDWLRVTGEKGGEVMSDNLSAAYTAVADSLSALGVSIVDMGATSAEFAFDLTVDAADLSINTIQSSFRELRRLQIAGVAIEGFDALLEKLTMDIETGKGITISSLILYKSEVKNDAEYIDKLAKRSEWKERLIGQISTIANAPIDGQVESWIVEATAEVSADSSKPEQMMVAYELVKRRAYAKIIAARAAEVENNMTGDTSSIEYPINVEWPDKFADDSDDLATDIENSYSTANTLRLIGTERTLFGAMEDGEYLQYLHMPLSPAVRDRSTEYLTSQINEYLAPYLREAEETLEDAQLKHYKAYLDTLVTNSVIEVTLGGREVAAGKTPDLEQKLLGLTVAQAKEFLEYLQLMRGTSGDPSEVKDLDFSAFSYDPSRDNAELDNLLANENVRRAVTSLDTSSPVTADEEKAEASVHTPPTSTELSAAKKAVAGEFTRDTTPLSHTDAEHLAGAIGRKDITADMEKAIRGAFNQEKNINALLAKDPSDENAIEEYSLYVMTLPEGENLNKVLDRLFTQYTEGLDADPDSDPNTSAFKNLITLRNAETRPFERARIQRVLDRTLITMAEHIRKQIAAVPTADLKDHPRYSDWKKRLGELYLASSTSPDRFSDAISMLIEYLLYEPENERYDEEKYRKDLKELTGKSVDIPLKEQYGSAIGGGARMRTTGAFRLFARHPSGLSVTEAYIQNSASRFEDLINEF